MAVAYTILQTTNVTGSKTGYTFVVLHNYKNHSLRTCVATKHGPVMPPPIPGESLSQHTRILPGYALLHVSLWKSTGKVYPFLRANHKLNAAGLGYNVMVRHMLV